MANIRFNQPTVVNNTIIQMEVVCETGAAQIKLPPSSTSGYINLSQNDTLTISVDLSSTDLNIVEDAEKGNNMLLQIIEDLQLEIEDLKNGQM